jgi:hypothetical protein
VSSTVRPADPTDLGAVDAAAAIRSRSLSAAEVTDACLARIAATDDDLRAWVVVDADGARAQARERDGAIAAAAVPPEYLLGDRTLYLDAFRRPAGDWLIARRELIVDATQRFPVKEWRASDGGRKLAPKADDYRTGVTVRQFPQASHPW